MRVETKAIAIYQRGETWTEFHGSLLVVVLGYFECSKAWPVSGQLIEGLEMGDGWSFMRASMERRIVNGAIHRRADSSLEKQVILSG